MIQPKTAFSAAHNISVSDGLFSGSRSSMTPVGTPPIMKPAGAAPGSSYLVLVVPIGLKSLPAKGFLVSQSTWPMAQYNSDLFSLLVCWFLSLAKGRRKNQGLIGSLVEDVCIGLIRIILNLRPVDGCLSHAYGPIYIVCM